MPKEKQDFNPFHRWRLTKGRPGGKNQMFQTLVIPSVKKKPKPVIPQQIMQSFSQPVAQSVPQQISQPVPIYQQYQKNQPKVNQKKEGIFYCAFQEFPILQRLV